MLIWYLRMKNWLKGEGGQDLVEYALLVVLIALALITILGTTQSSIEAVFQNIVDTLGGL
ncbi:MAG TPA: Flp family type IVb pilin [Caldilineae bacterium]|nr:Flp family type IVb pilin [Caldilineae bacterium]